MNKRLLLIIGIVIALGAIVLLVLDILHIAITAIVLLMDLVVVYSYTTRKDRDIPEDLHDSYEEAYDEKNEEEKEDFFEKKVKVCLICNTENSIHRKYCRKCNNLIQNIVCPVCGVNNPHTAKYCRKCDSILQNKTRS